MSPRAQICDHIQKLLEKAGIITEIRQFVQPPESSMGDVSLPCFLIAKTRKKNPTECANELLSVVRPHIVNDVLIKSVHASGPYLNFFLHAHAMSVRVLRVVEREKKKYGQRTTETKYLLFEYSQPNTHKAFHIGHLRNVLLGWSLTQLYKSQGNKIQTVTYVNDVGAHVAQCLWALEFLHENETPPSEKGQWLGEVYTEATNILEKKPELKTHVQSLLQKLESGDSETRTLWKMTRQWSLDGFEKIYKILGVSFDNNYYESDVRENGQAIVDTLLSRDIAKISQDVVIADLTSYTLDVLVLRKSDGTGLYATSDLGLAAAKEKETWDMSIILTDIRQTLYFKQLFKIFELLGNRRAMRHIGYEFVTLKSGSMSSRKGNVVLFEHFFEEIMHHAFEETKMRHADWSLSQLKKTAHAIALAAIKFSMLKVKPSQVIMFDPKEALSFEGYNGPYVMYMYARIASLLKKAGPFSGTSGHTFDTTQEHALLLHLGTFPEIVKEACDSEDPSLICKYLFTLSQLFSSFYEHCPVLHENPRVRKGRLRLARATATALENGFALLGITPIKEM